MVTTFTYKPSFGEDRVNRPLTHPPTDRTDYNTLRRSFASAQCNYQQERAVPDVMKLDVSSLLA